MCACLLPALVACGNNEAGGDAPAPKTTSTQFALYALSRGKGVPEPTRIALQKARTYLEDARQRGEVVMLKESRIGLEGETRVCVEARDSAMAIQLQRQVRSIAGNVELFNIVEETCSGK